MKEKGGVFPPFELSCVSRDITTNLSVSTMLEHIKSETIQTHEAQPIFAPPDYIVHKTMYNKNPPRSHDPPLPEP